MFAIKTVTEPTSLEKETERLLELLSEMQPETEEYAATADQLVKLYKLKEVDSKKVVSPDALVTIAGNLFGIAVIIGYERAHIITSKALGFVTKLTR